MKPVALVFMVFFCVILEAVAAETSDQSTIYDSNPKHLWNRLNETLFNRTAPDGKRYGLDELDILYWRTTKHLLTAPSRQQAFRVLDEFIHSHGENLIHDPLKRALLQRDLWELFDWSAKPFRQPDNARACGELQLRLATIIRRLALATNDIASLPDNYAQSQKQHFPDFPKGLFQTNGDWVAVGFAGYGDEPVAPTHVMHFDGHSAFAVFLRVPDGRKAALEYLEKLRRFKQTERVWVYQTNRFRWASTNAPGEVLELNANLPQFGIHTEWALVRQMCIIDSDGRIEPTPITESIQLRRYLHTDKGIPDQRFSTDDVQQFFEFQLDKRQNADLRAIGRDETGFPFVHFMGKGIDLFEPSFWNPSAAEKSDSATLKSTLLQHCFECHSARGVFSVLSYTGFTSPSLAELPADLGPVEIAREVTAAIYWKQRQYDWGLLQGLWLQNQ